ncbi:MAG: Smr/MutS family protein [Bryobacterales bacterium]|nr:Smr/MutS family protein [Bryobacterales bacterium]
MAEQDDPMVLPVTDVFDLHTVPPRDAKAAVEAYLEAAEAKGLRYLRIVHGKGIGVQREMVRKVLAGSPSVRRYGDAPAEAGGWGATLVELGEPAMDELDALLKQYDEALAEVEALAAPLTAERRNWRAAAESWSVGQCLDHLAKVGSTYGGKIEAAIRQGRRDGVTGSGPFSYGWLESFFLRATEPPPRFRVPAPRIFRPAVQAEGTVEAYRAANRRLRGLVEEARGLDLRKVKVSSPASDWVRFSLGIGLAVAVAHERRHLYQMRGIVEAMGRG